MKSSPGNVALPAINSLIAGRYLVLAERGEGMMGVVFQAEDRLTGQHLAIKVLRPEAVDVPGIAERLEREGQIIATLKSENVVRVFDVGTTEAGLPFFTMELLEGDDLMKVLDAGEKFPLGAAVRLIRDACAGLAEAHAKGVVHRDLKPQNLFLSRQPDGRTLLKILDFGVSKQTGGGAAELTATTASLGTPLYMSPEQVRSSKSVDERSDVWALGVVLFELVTGRPPFWGESAHGVAAAIVADAPLKLRDLMPEAPEGLERVLLATMEKDPARRIPTARALYDALTPYASNLASSDLPSLATIVEMPAVGSMMVAPMAASVRMSAMPAPQLPPLPPPPASPTLTEHAGAPLHSAPRPIYTVMDASARAPAPAPPPVVARAVPPPVKQPPFIILGLIGVVALIIVVAIVFAGIDRRKSKGNTTSPARSGPVTTTQALGPSITFGEAFVNAGVATTNRFEPCILRPSNASFPAIVPTTPVARVTIDADPKLRETPAPTIVLRMEPKQVIPPDSLLLEPLTPLFPALRNESIPVFFVTNEGFYVALLNDKLVQEVTGEDGEPHLAANMVSSAAGWVVVAEGPTPVARLQRALALLADSPGSITLAMPVPPDADPPPPTVAPSRIGACDGASGARDASEADRAAFGPQLATLTKGCMKEAPWTSGRKVRLVVRPGAKSSTACIESAEIDSPSQRACIVSEATKLSPKTKGPLEPLRFDLLLNGPRIRPLCGL